MLVGLAVLFAGCAQFNNGLQETREPDKDAKIFGLDMPANARVAERLNVYFSEEMALELERETGEDGLVRLPGVKSFQSSGIVKMRRLFPEAGKFEARTRREGLHRWYVVDYDPEVSLTKAAQDWSALPGVESVEFIPSEHISGTAVVSEDLPAGRTAAKDLPFNDPRLSDQWHYYNDGSVASSVSGCDINVFPVWKKYTTGSEDVIVAVVDGGIDFTHEDLAANMWENPEKKGDARFGYNFCNDTYQVTPDDHGTHVAGTIAAVNNNGIGVCGIAGGDAAKGIKGVRLMSCQIFEGEKGSGAGPVAIKWGADHGAVISQNSWGYLEATETPKSLQAAVDYFIKYAGLDENDVQVGPMKGGIVIFAAGNENQDVSGNGYGPIFNVASVGADFRRAYYSNYGDWIDITAPGGDVKKGNQVLSTFPGNKYGYYQGTSMACPHVSGVAALIVSKFGGAGFTPDELEKRMVESAVPIQSFNRKFGMGAGLVNAYGAIAGQGGIAPEVPGSFSVTTQSNNLKFSATVPKDADDDIPTSIVVYYSTSPFSAISDKLMFGQFYLGDMKRGDRVEGTIVGLEFNKKYYVAAAAKDLAGNLSGLTAVSEVTTGGNSKPVIQAKDGTSVSLKPHEVKSLGFEIIEPDDHFYTIELQRENEGLVLDTLVRNMPKVVVNGPASPSGTFTATLVVTDTYGATASQVVKYTVLENHAPVVSKQFEDRVYNSRAAVTEEFACADYFRDEDGEVLAYTFSISNENVINMTFQDGKFFLTPMNYGYATVTVTGTDVRGASATQSFQVLIRDGSQALDVYPNPVSDYLYVRTSETASASLRVVSSSGATVYSDDLTITPFDPAKVDVRSFAPGVYTVLLDYNGEQIKKSIVKL